MTRSCQVGEPFSNRCPLESPRINSECLFPLPRTQFCRTTWGRLGTASASTRAVEREGTLYTNRDRWKRPTNLRPIFVSKWVILSRCLVKYVHSGKRKLGTLTRVKNKRSRKSRVFVVRWKDRSSRGPRGYHHDPFTFRLSI